MNLKLKKLKKLCGEIHDLNTANAVLEWDQQVNMPAAGSAGRAMQMSLLSSLAHEKETSAEYGELLEELKSFRNELSPESDDFCLLRILQRDYERARRIPAEYIEEFSRETGTAFNIWEQARKAKDFKIFQPSLERIFNLRRQYAEFFAPYEHIYDPLLEDFEPGIKTAEVIKIFEILRREQIILLDKTLASQQPDSKILNGHFDPKAQWQLARESASMLGFDWERGRLDKSSHPFTTTFNLNDVRITTNVCEKNILSSLYSTMHECGHALYEQGIAQELDRTPLGTGASLAIHESQSRLWENIVGRSLDFLTAFYPQIQAKFPKQFQHVALNDFYRAVNQVRPSLIRTESDEMTYNLHIMLRLELEIEVLEKRTDVADLPEAWRNKMNDYLGVIPKNDAEGVLQDVHWAGGAIGYFPTYALGNVISAQIWETALNELPNLQKQIRSGNLAELRNWLREKLHRHGGKFYPSELVKNITGNAIDPKPYLNYLKQKYSMARKELGVRS